MGEEVPESLLDSTEKYSVFGNNSESQGYKTTTDIGDKIYVVEGSEDSDDSEIGVKIFDKQTGKWSVPTVLGTKPIPSKGHSAILLNENRILILKAESSPGDCIWFLEVDTPFVKQQKKLLGAEVVAWSKAVTGDGLRPIVISGPSGVGKGTLISKLMKEFPSSFGFSISHTTRAPRAKEVNGVHYHFTERGMMEKDIKEGKFLESASVHGNLYGTSIEAVEAVMDDGKRCILDIDVQGARSVRASSLEAIFIFNVPPSFDELERRLRSRGTETEEQVQRRLRNAKAELEQGKSPGLFDHILVNDDIETCYQNLKKLLALHDSPGASDRQGAANFKILIGHSVFKKEGKILINFDDTHLETSNPSMFVLDVSSLKGGAPGRTRGLHISAVSSATETVDGFEQL